MTAGGVALFIIVCLLLAVVIYAITQEIPRT